MDSNNSQNEGITDEPIQPVPTFSRLSDNDDITAEDIPFDDTDDSDDFQNETKIDDDFDIVNEDIPFDDKEEDTEFQNEIVEVQTPMERKTYSITANIDPQSWSILRGEFQGYGLNEQTSFPEFVQKLIENRAVLLTDKEASKQEAEIKVEKAQMTTTPNPIAPIYTHKKFSKTSIILAVIGGVLALGFVVWAIWKLRTNAAVIKKMTATAGSFFEIPTTV